MNKSMLILQLRLLREMASFLGKVYFAFGYKGWGIVWGVVLYFSFLGSSFCIFRYTIDYSSFILLCLLTNQWDLVI